MRPTEGFTVFAYDDYPDRRSWIPAEVHRHKDRDLAMRTFHRMCAIHARVTVFSFAEKRVIATTLKVEETPL